jgi:hypothetical protein
MDLTSEAARATALLAGRTVQTVRRHRVEELVIEFTDGSRLFVDAPVALELSVTGLDNPERQGK